MANALTRARLRICAALIACCASTVCDWPWRHDMGDQPSPPTSGGPRSPAPGAIPREAAGPFDRIEGESAGNPLRPGANPSAGRALYTMYCLPCHGGPVARFFPPIPSLAGPTLQQHGDGWWYATITNGTARMPPYGHELDPLERWAIVRFVRDENPQ